MSGKIVVITGASSGIGLLTAVELARRGHTVVATMRDLARRTRLDEAAAAAGVAGRLDFRRLNVTEFDSLPTVVAEIVRDHGRIDVLVNNAGFAVAGFAEDLKLEEIRMQFETNFFGHVAMTKAVIPVMRKQSSGHIIMIASIAGRAASPVTSSYAASKFALEGWSEALRIELRSLGIRVVLVEPGAFQTDIWERNVHLGEFAISPESPNHERGKRFTEFVRTEVHKRDARVVAELIARIAENPSPKLRYRIGADAHLQFWLRAILPWKTYERLIERTMRIG
ncbi:MAG: SDR family oxidoreductase [Acidobacteriota bacterium]|nr:SDR family oxidoreductase [Acidobacteriota bacterium]